MLYDSDVQPHKTDHRIYEVLPNINVITVPKEIQKADFITPNGAILVDDHLPNLEYWFEKGGKPILFSKKYKSCQFENITDLLELFSKNKIKVRE